jgi:hypothetical protein
MLNTRDTAKIFKHYMGRYFVKPDPKLYVYFQKKFAEAEEQGKNTIYCHDTRFKLKQCGLAYLDYKGTYQQHTQIDSYDIVDAFLHLREDMYSRSFYDFPPSPLIIYHITGTTDNRKLFPLIKHIYNYRHMNNQKTLILSEENILKDLLTTERITPIVNISKVQDDIVDVDLGL